MKRSMIVILALMSFSALANPFREAEKAMDLSAKCIRKAYGEDRAINFHSGGFSATNFDSLNGETITIIEVLPREKNTSATILAQADEDGVLRVLHIKQSIVTQNKTDNISMAGPGKDESLCE